MLKISAFYLEKQKSFLPRKIRSKPESLNRPKQFQQMAFAVPIFNDGFGLLLRKNVSLLCVGFVGNRRKHKRVLCFQYSRRFNQLSKASKAWNRLESKSKHIFLYISYQIDTTFRILDIDRKVKNNWQNIKLGHFDIQKR